MAPLLVSSGSGSGSSTLVLPLLLTTLLITLSSTSRAQSLYQFCGASEGNFTANSTYQANLQSLLDSLSSNGSATGFAGGTIGNIPDRINGNVLCRGDATASTCQTCIRSAVEDVQQACPFRKSAVIWYDNCLLHYSNQRFQAVDTLRKIYLINTQNITSESSRFNDSLATLFDQLIRYAAYNTTAPQPRMFATGQMPFNRQYPTIYVLLQCTRDLSPDECNQCLRNIFGDLQNMNNREGGRVLVPACNFRFEVYPFYNGSSRLSLPAVGIIAPPPPPLPPPPVSLPPSNGSTANSPDGTRRKKTRIILAIAIPLGIAAVITLILCACCLKKKEAIEYHRSPEEEIPSSASLFFDLLTIRSATDNFSPSNKLGEGGFGTVYKGILPDQRAIAAKRLSKSSGQGLEQLKNEVVLLAKLQHRNLVRLLGICLEDEEKILLYEYVQNRSLDTFLFDPNKKDQLHWERRNKIIAGIARGLLYLHEESQVKIIHRDLKASNILLDASMSPKISDFGLARLFGGDQSEANTSRVVGTFGYMSPEYAMRGQFSNKSDVFSFGVIILEILTGRKSNNFFNSGNSADLLSYVWEHWSRGAITDILDPSLTRSCPQNEALRCIHIGLLCVQENPADRPTMSSVILMLNSCTVSLQVPSRPPFFLSYSREGSISESVKTDMLNVSATQFTTKSEIYSPNDMSVTELDPR